MTNDIIQANIAKHEARMAELQGHLSALAQQRVQAETEFVERRGACAALQELLALQPDPEPKKNGKAALSAVN